MENIQQNPNSTQSTNLEQPQTPATNQPAQGGAGLEPNIAAALAYLVPLVCGVVFVIIEKQNKFVRFHAFQSILFGIASWLALIISQALYAVFIGAILAPLVSLGIFVLWIILMWKAYNHVEFELPYIGKIAKNMAAK